ncbi:MAG: Na+ dependent nucleoside transporter N-terminal domain-containing protein, partial [Myxococcota bacterium]|nr:Na+ dependent nucleoside transporter N-terminal domain-containing protein [Myxococcota bacterium]
MLATATLYKALSLSGVFVFLFIAWLFSVDRKNIPWRTVGWGVGLQFIFALIVLHPLMQDFFFDVVSVAVTRLLSFAEDGATFVFGTMEAHEVT